MYYIVTRTEKRTSEKPQNDTLANTGLFFSEFEDLEVVRKNLPAGWQLVGELSQSKNGVNLLRSYHWLVEEAGVLVWNENPPEDRNTIDPEAWRVIVDLGNGGEDSLPPGFRHEGRFKTSTSDAFNKAIEGAKPHESTSSPIHVVPRKKEEHNIVEGMKWSSHIGVNYHGGLWQGDTGQMVPNNVHTCTKCGRSVDLNKVKNRRQTLRVFRNSECPGTIWSRMYDPSDDLPKPNGGPKGML